MISKIVEHIFLFKIKRFFFIRALNLEALDDAIIFIYKI